MKLPAITRTLCDASAFSMIASVSSRVWKPRHASTSAEPGQGGGFGLPPVAISSASYLSSWPRLVCATFSCRSMSVAQVSKWMSMFCAAEDRKSTRLNSSHLVISYAVFCLQKKNGPLGQLAALALVLELADHVHQGLGGFQQIDQLAEPQSAVRVAAVSAQQHELAPVLTGS